MEPTFGRILTSLSLTGQALESDGRSAGYAPQPDRAQRRRAARRYARAVTAVGQMHPSGAQYRLWVDRILPVVAELLDEGPGEVNGRCA